TVVSGCQAGEDPARGSMRARLKQESRLSPEEVAAVFAQIAPAIAGKNVTVKQGALTRVLDQDQRASVLGMLSDPGAVYDGGLRADGQHMRGALKTGGTATPSELDG